MGTIGIAAIARSAAPTTATGFLCVAGIIDLRTFMRARRSRNGHDCLAYAVAALACALVAMRGGIALVNPKIAIALWPCAIVFAGLAYRYRMHACGALIYRATETTLADACPGDRMDFTGILTRSESATTLVRYAITCSRADAAPIAVRLDSPSATVQRGWCSAAGPTRAARSCSAARDCVCGSIGSNQHPRPRIRSSIVRFARAARATRPECRSDLQ